MQPAQVVLFSFVPMTETRCPLEGTLRGLLTRSDAIDSDANMFLRCAAAQPNNGVLAGAVG